MAGAPPALAATCRRLASLLYRLNCRFAQLTALGGADELGFTYPSVPDQSFSKSQHRLRAVGGVGEAPTRSDLG